MPARIVHTSTAALCILGGLTDTLRPGGRVEARGLGGARAAAAPKEKGILCYCDRYTGIAKVILDTRPGKVSFLIFFFLLY